ncbi:hypothetical protein NQZ68_008448 [Dissostichus eleginoides]|nr:hypothetical protein NQZ68_008448 [Dissostichus eleginoides]
MVMRLRETALTRRRRKLQRNDLASMDPADTGHQSKTADELSQALASQGALVGHHNVVLREVVETLRNLSANVQRIGTQVELLTTQYSPPQPAAQPAAPPPAPAAPLYQLREAVIPTPERYAGDLDPSRFLTRSHPQKMSPCKWEGPASHHLSVLEGSGLENVSGSSVAVGILASPSSSLNPRPRTQLEAVLCCNQQSLPLLALVDSGADENFLDINIAAQAGIPSEVLDSPLNANALNVCPTACRDRHSTTQDRAA